MQLTALVASALSMKVITTDQARMSYTFGPQLPKQLPQPSFRVYKNDGTLVEPPQPLTKEDIAMIHRETALRQVSGGHKHSTMHG